MNLLSEWCSCYELEKTCYKIDTAVENYGPFRFVSEMVLSKLTTQQYNAILVLDEDMLYFGCIDKQAAPEIACGKI